MGASKLEVYWLLNKDSGETLVPTPQFLPYPIVTPEEVMVYQCWPCGVWRKYSHVGGNVDVWRCVQREGETRLPVADRLR